MPIPVAGKKNLRSSNSTQIMHGMRAQYSTCRVSMPSIWWSLSHVYAVKSEYKLCEFLIGGVNSPLVREDRDGIFKLQRSPGINSKESIPPAYIVWRAGTTTWRRPGDQIACISVDNVGLKMFVVNTSTTCIYLRVITKCTLNTVQSNPGMEKKGLVYSSCGTFLYRKRL
jgi:hypothetical protein